MRDVSRGGSGSPLYLLTGLVLGVIIGVLVALAFIPPTYVDTSPASLAPAEKDQLRGLIALAYLADHDLGRAQARLALLKDENIQGLLAAKAQQILAAGGSPDEARAMAVLAEDLVKAPVQPTAELAQALTDEPLSGSESPVDLPTLDMSSAIQTPTKAPLASITPQASLEPLSTEIPVSIINAPFALESKEEICDPDLKEPLLQVDVMDKNALPVPGIRIEVTWDGGENYFYTGLFPQYDSGYADYAMQTDISYSLRAGVSGETVHGLKTHSCTSSSGAAYLGGWKLTFVQP